MLNGRANDIKKHKWFEGLDWEALEARKITPLRKPKEDSAKRLKELTVSVTAQPLHCCAVHCGISACRSCALQSLWFAQTAKVAACIHSILEQCRDV